MRYLSWLLDCRSHLKPGQKYQYHVVRCYIESQWSVQVGRSLLMWYLSYAVGSNLSWQCSNYLLLGKCNQCGEICEINCSEAEYGNILISSWNINLNWCASDSPGSAGKKPWRISFSEMIEGFFPRQYPGASMSHQVSLILLEDFRWINYSVFCETNMLLRT